MYLETFKIFCDLVTEGSFSKTAEQNSLSQSAVSQQLAQLELEYRCQLIDRKKRPIELTREGRLFYKTAKDIIERYEQFQSELNSLKSTTGFRINVGSIYSIGMHTLPRYVKSFMLRYPKVYIHIEYLEASRIYKQVLSGEIDFGFVAVPQRGKRLVVYEFENEPLVLVCSPSHPFSEKEEIDIHEIQFERFVGFGKRIPTRSWIDNILGRYDIVIKPALEFDNIETVKRAVEINSGISILSSTAIRQEVSDGTLIAIPFSNEHFYRPTGIIHRIDKILSKIDKGFLKIFQEGNLR